MNQARSDCYIESDRTGDDGEGMTGRGLCRDVNGHTTHSDVAGLSKWRETSQARCGGEQESEAVCRGVVAGRHNLSQQRCCWCGERCGGETQYP
jgi:hypothetical protein